MEKKVIPLSITFLNPEILGFLFPTKNGLTWGVKVEKLNFWKSQNFLDKLRKLYTDGMVIE